MCWSARASLNTFAFSLFGFAIGLINNYHLPMLIFMMTFSTVQLAEYFIWTHLKNARKNELASKFLFLILVLEPYAASLVIPDKTVRTGFIIAYTIFLLISSPYILSKDTKWHSSPGANGHLQWHWVTSTTWILIAWSVFLIAPFLLAKRYYSLIFGILTLVVSVYFFWRYKTAGTMWCWVATFSWLCVIYLSLTHKGDALCFKTQ